MNNSRIGEAFPMGATVIGKKAVQFVSRINQEKETSLILYEKNTGETEEYKLTDEYRIGNMYSIVIEDIDPAKYTYNYCENGKKILDPYAKIVCGNETWGEPESDCLRAGIRIENFKWEDDKVLMLPYDQSVIYQLHVRGFTKHASSGVRKKGTFEGVVEKIPYLKDLGITAIELLPSYEFMECEKEPPKVLTMEYVKENYMTPSEEKPEIKINYWGFKEAYYFAPKASYSAGKNPVNSFKNMVKELHKAGIEVVMQFYFPQSISRSYILEVLKYWVREYHIDGVRLLGVNIPVSVIATQPELVNTKIMYEYIPVQDIYDYRYVPAYKNLAEYIVKQPMEGTEEYEQLSLFAPVQQKQLLSISSSRNLIRPEPQVKEVKHFTMRPILEYGPKPKKGYYIDKDSIVSGINPYTGLSYLKYTEIRIRGKTERGYP